jgi:hypothetical protein
LWELFGDLGDFIDNTGIIRSTIEEEKKKGDMV